MKNQQPIGTCALLLNTQGQILLGKRKNSYKAGLYGLPGGRVTVGEPVAAAIQREVLEETGIKLESLEYVGAVRENQGDYDFIHFVYVAKNVDEEPRLCEPDKCEGWEWVDLDVIGNEVLPGHLAAIRMYQKDEKLVDLIS